MNRLTFFLIFVLSGYNSLAQNIIPNSGFENWYVDTFYGNPRDRLIDWTNCEFVQEKGTDAHWGQFALKYSIENDYYTYPCLHFTQGRCKPLPDYLFGYFKFQKSLAEFTTRVEIFFTDSISKLYFDKYHYDIDSSRIYGYGNLILHDTTEKYSEFKVEINYTDSSRCDSFIIVIWPVSTFSKYPEMQLLVSYYDDLSFSSRAGLTEIKEQRIEVYPNPTNNKLFVHINKNTEEKTQLTISDLSGKTYINEQLVVSENFEIDVSHLNSGIYFITLKGKEIYRTKFIIQ